MIKQPEISIYSTVSLDAMLIDTRVGRFGQKFGTVKDICRQYGINCIKHDGYMEFSAPKLRLQLFMEKLHFSRTGYAKRNK